MCSFVVEVCEVKIFFCKFCSINMVALCQAVSAQKKKSRFDEQLKKEWG